MRNSREAEEQSAELAKLGSAEQNIRGRSGGERELGSPQSSPASARLALIAASLVSSSAMSPFSCAICAS